MQVPFRKPISKECLITYNISHSVLFNWNHSSYFGLLKPFAVEFFSLTILWESQYIKEYTETNFSSSACHWVKSRPLSIPCPCANSAHCTHTHTCPCTHTHTFLQDGSWLLKQLSIILDIVKNLELYKPTAKGLSLFFIFKDIDSFHIKEGGRK